MNLHLSGCTLGGGETLRRSVPRFLIFFLRRIALCVSERVVCAHTHGEGRRGRGFASSPPQHVNLYFMMSRCSREAGHGTCRKEHEVGFERVWEGRVNAKGLGQEQLRDAI